MLVPLTDDDQAVVDTARAVLDDLGGRRVPPPGFFDAELWERIAQLGWFGIAVPEVDGGAGASFAELGLVIEQIGRVLAPVPFVAQVTALHAVSTYGDETQRRTILPQLLDGSRRAALAVQAHDEGVHAEPAGPGTVTLSGRTSKVLGAVGARLVVVSAMTAGGVGLFVADVDDGVTVRPGPGLDLRRDLGAYAFHGTSAAPLGDAADGTAADREVAVTTVALACEAAGAAGRCLELIVEHLTIRQQFGRPIGTFQGLRHRCATLLIENIAATAAVRLAAGEVDGEHEGLMLAASAASLATTTTLLTAAKECVQMHGGMGFSWDLDAHLYLRRAKSDQNLLGTTRFHAARVADALGVARAVSGAVEQLPSVDA